jgi:hypothetical protein
MSSEKVYIEHVTGFLVKKNGYIVDFFDSGKKAKEAKEKMELADRYTELKGRLLKTCPYLIKAIDLDTDYMDTLEDIQDYIIVRKKMKNKMDNGK